MLAQSNTKSLVACIMVWQANGDFVANYYITALLLYAHTPNPKYPEMTLGTLKSFNS